jgi:Listeria/Bacterioides repeat
LTKDGYTFNGWYDNDAFSGSAVSSIAEGTTGDKTFYAKWGNTGTDPIEYSIVYMDSVGGTIVGGGVGIQSPNFNVLSYNVTSTVTLYDLEKSGYTFNGWFDNAAFSGNPVTNFGPGETGDKTFHAGWKKTGGNNGGSTTGGAVVVNPETPQPADEPGSGFNEEEEDKGTKEEEPQPEPGTPRYWWWLLLLLLLLLICYGYYRYRNSKNN